ncbi:caspase domain-containing protein [Crassisporium funariophilum]|nr:caspase domain-containing protein [Crassisporium funariophilum]
MKIVKYRAFLPGLRSAAILGDDRSRAMPAPPTFKKKALLVGIKDVGRKPDSPQGHERPTMNGGDIGAPRACLPKKGKRKANAIIENQSLLKGPHRDVLDMRQLLIDKYHYAPEDITVLIDNDDPEQLQPTRYNILLKIEELVSGAREGDRFFFHFAGHTAQQDTDDKREEDGKDECILTSDGEMIKDDILRQRLVDPLPVGSHLVAVLDSCHSASLLGEQILSLQFWIKITVVDLLHIRCNRVYVPWTSKGRRKTDTLRNGQRRHNARISAPIRTVTQAMRITNNAIKWKRKSIDQILSSINSPGFELPQFSVSKTQKSLSISTEGMWIGTSVSPINRCNSPVITVCDGWCREKDRSTETDNGPAADVVCEPAADVVCEPAADVVCKSAADVISLSSSKDGQRSWENSDGSSMTQALIKLLRNDPNPSLKDLLAIVSHNLHDFYIGLHKKAHDYKKEVQIFNTTRQARGKRPMQRKSVEMDNFQDPQLSSSQPLDMDRRWHI